AVTPRLAREAARSLLPGRVAAVPTGQPAAQHLGLVTDAGQAVLAPAIGAGPRMVVREVAPGVALRAVVLAHRGPRPLADIGTPPFPVAAVRCQAAPLRIG